MLAIIGAGGLKNFKDIEVKKTYANTDLENGNPYGTPSGAIHILDIEGKDVAVFSRHGDEEQLIPSKIPFRANIFALKNLGVRHIVAVSLATSIIEENSGLSLGDLVLPQDYINLAHLRPTTFFEKGLTIHADSNNLTSPLLSPKIAKAAKKLGLDIKTEVANEPIVNICTEGPQCMSPAEMCMYRSDLSGSGRGAHISTMTNATEAVLAYAANIHYAAINVIGGTGPDYSHPAGDPVKFYIETFQEKVVPLLRELVRTFKSEDNSGPFHAVVDNGQQVEGLKADSASGNQQASKLLEAYNVLSR